MLIRRWADKNVFAPVTTLRDWGIRRSNFFDSVPENSRGQLGRLKYLKKIKGVWFLLLDLSLVTTAKGTWNELIDLQNFSMLICFYFEGPYFTLYGKSNPSQKFWSVSVLCRLFWGHSQSIINKLGQMSGWDHFRLKWTQIWTLPLNQSW